MSDQQQSLQTKSMPKFATVRSPMYYKHLSANNFSRIDNVELLLRPNGEESANHNVLILSSGFGGIAFTN